MLWDVIWKVALLSLSSTSPTSCRFSDAEVRNTFSEARPLRFLKAITVSEEQTRFGKELCRGYAVDIRLQDYRSLRGKFDRVLSIGMFEHVGYKNYVSFMHKVKTCLKDDGLFLLHTIGGNRSVFHVDPWTQRYIFSNSMLPSTTLGIRSLGL